MDSETAAFLDAWREEPSLTAVAKRLGVTYWAVQSKAARLRHKGIDLPPRKRGRAHKPADPLRDRAIGVLLLNGFSQAEVARLLDLSRQRVNQVRWRAEVSVRKRR